MATLASIYKEINRHAAMFDSFRSLTYEATKTARFLETFQRDNKLIAQSYSDTVRKYLAERGWYVGATLTASQLAMLDSRIREGGFDTEIEALMVNHVRTEIDQIQNLACATWPKREMILNDTFEAHRSGHFTLCIPSLLAQADGMAFDIIDAYAFTNHSGNITDKAQIFIDDEIADRCLMSSFVGIFLEESGMRINTAKRDKKKGAGDPVSPLNRHGVMHGLDLDYPSEPNSLRVVSLIGLLTTIHSVKAAGKDA